MSLKYFIVVCMFGLALAGPEVCVDPLRAKHLAYEEEIHVEAPSFGRVEKTVYVPKGRILNDKVVTCVVLTEVGENPGHARIASVNPVDGSVKLVSEIQKGIDVEVSVYTE